MKYLVLIFLLLFLASCVGGSLLALPTAAEDMIVTSDVTSDVASAGRGHHFVSKEEKQDWGLACDNMGPTTTITLSGTVSDNEAVILFGISINESAVQAIPMYDGVWSYSVMVSSGAPATKAIIVMMDDQRKVSTEVVTLQADPVQVVPDTNN